MSPLSRRSTPVFSKAFRYASVAILLTWAILGLTTNHRELPDGVSFQGQRYAAHQVEFLSDLTWQDNQGSRQLDQEIFDNVLELIAGAETYLLLDLFLFNAFQGPEPERHRNLSDEITAALISKRRAKPEMPILVITDPVNTVYRGYESPHLTRLRQAGIPVVMTHLPSLRDSNRVYSPLWRVLFRHLGNEAARTVPNPLGEGRVSVRSYLHILNFKANHRKVVLVGRQNGSEAMVMTANPHDGSSAHSNAAIRFSGPATRELLHTELAVARFSAADNPIYPGSDEHALAALIEQIEIVAIQSDNRSTPVHPSPDAASIQIVTEGQIQRALLATIDSAGDGDSLNIAVFYLSDRDIISALKSAVGRGSQVRVLLDPNKDAFGKQKNGVPNRPVAHELKSAGAEIRWCNTQGEQCHGKLLQLTRQDQSVVITGSANFTRRNLDDLNLESSVVITAPVDNELIQAVAGWFRNRWFNNDERRYSLDYEAFADDAWSKKWLYRFMETTGISTF